jgi:serine/threonine-protein kinase PRP4
LHIQGRNNNGMLKEIFDLKGKPSKQWIGKGTFKHEHFDEASTFVYMEEDKNTGNVVPKMINYTAPVKDLKSILIGSGVSKPKNEAEKRQVLQLKDLLEKMLVIDHEKRISPKDALNHPFITSR